MKTKIQNDNVNFWVLLSKIREAFGDDHILLTFLSDDFSTFGEDNVEQLPNWLILQRAKLVSGSLDSLSLVVRRFLIGENNEIEITLPNGKLMKIPKKEIYHFCFTKDEILLLNKEETFKYQNTDASTSEPLEPEEDVIIMSSEELWDEIMDNKYSVDNVLDKINSIGENNLTKHEQEFLISNSKK